MERFKALHLDLFALNMRNSVISLRISLRNIQIYKIKFFVFFFIFRYIIKSIKNNGIKGSYS